MVAALLAVLVGGARQWWVFGWQFRMVQEDRDRWRDIALNGSDLATKAVTTLARR